MSDGESVTIATHEPREEPSTELRIQFRKSLYGEVNKRLINSEYADREFLRSYIPTMMKYRISGVDVMLRAQDVCSKWRAELYRYMTDSTTRECEPSDLVIAQFGECVTGNIHGNATASEVSMINELWKSMLPSNTYQVNVMLDFGSIIAHPELVEYLKT